jgi:hypothetical protein
MAKMMCEVLFDEIKTEHTPANLFVINTIFQINISNKTHLLLSLTVSRFQFKKKTNQECCLIFCFIETF